jgi:hypothetical protein
MKNEPAQELQLATPAPSQLPAEISPQMPVASMLEAAIKGGVTAENVAVVERLTALYERMQAKDAENKFTAAFVALQSEMPRITADKTVPDKYGNLKYKFAPYESIMDAVRPLLQKHGFTVTFSMSYSEGRVIQRCTLQHIAGHSRTNEFAARIGNGPPGSSEAQGDGAASTYAKRFAFCNALNITIESDSDGKNDIRNDGEVIPDDKVQYLRERVKETGFHEGSFLKLAGVNSYEEIRQGSYEVLTRALDMKARKAP